MKKQSGGHGQFAVVNLRVSPLPRGAGVEFNDSIVGGAIPKQFVQATQHGAEDALATGGQLGLPIVDIAVDCYDGKTHSVDSSDMAFRTAASQGVLEAVEAAGPVVLEPIARLIITVPSDAQGEVLGDLSGEEKVVVKATSNVKGNIVAPRVSLEEGAKFKGMIDMSQAESNDNRSVMSEKSKNTKSTDSKESVISKKA